MQLKYKKTVIEMPTARYSLSVSKQMNIFSITNKEILKVTEPEWNNVTLEELVFLIRLFPDCHLPEGISFETVSEKEIIRIYRERYEGISIWLEHLAAKKPLSPDAESTNYKYFEPYARLYAAQLDLVEKVHPRSILSDLFESPLDAWGFLIYFQCRNQLNDSGLLGKLLDERKVETCNQELELLRRCNEREITLIPSDNHQANKHPISLYESPKQFLTVLASDIAQQDPDFYWHCWVPYREKVSKWQRKIKDCKELQLVFLSPNGNLDMTGKGKKAPKLSNSHKGFGHLRM